MMIKFLLVVVLLVSVASTPVGATTIAPKGADVFIHARLQGPGYPSSQQVQLYHVVISTYGANWSQLDGWYTSDDNGVITLVNVSVECFPCWVYVKPENWLSAVGQVDIYSYASVDVYPDSYNLAGDANNNNVVNSGDFAYLHNSFGFGCGNPYYDYRADWNKDCVVNSVDFGLYHGNFGVSGPAMYCYPCPRY